MGSILLINTILIGAFAFASIHHFFLWRLSRTTLPLLIGINCGLSSATGLAIVGIGSATTLDAAQRALDARVIFATLTVLSIVWLVAEITHVRPRGYLVVTFAVMLIRAVSVLFGYSAAGRVTGLVVHTMLGAWAGLGASGLGRRRVGSGPYNGSSVNVRPG